MEKWEQVKEAWLIGTKPNYRSETVTILNKKGIAFVCKIWYNKKKELTYISVSDLSGDENLVKDLVRNTGGKIRSLTGIKLI